MTLQHPTMAQQALDAWNARGKTISLGALLDEQFGDKIVFEQFVYPWRTWHFEDDTRLRAKGTGRNHTVEAILP